MTKKKTVKKKAAPRRKKLTVAPKQLNRNAIDIDDDPQPVTLNIKHDGVYVGTIDSDICTLHRMALIAQMMRSPKIKMITCLPMHRN